MPESKCPACGHAWEAHMSLPEGGSDICTDCEDVCDGGSQ